MVPAGAGVERGGAALAAVRFPLLLEATAGMLETSPPSQSAGQPREPQASGGGAPTARQVSASRDCAASRTASGSPTLRCCHRSGRSRAVFGAAGRRGSQAKASRSRMRVGGKATGSLMEGDRPDSRNKPAPRIPLGGKLRWNSCSEPRHSPRGEEGRDSPRRLRRERMCSHRSAGEAGTHASERLVAPGGILF
ncbi:uncharacterized protein ACBT57_006077 [Dama dama]|uniref:protein SPT2 homolog n=1 Tax=Dama dama TaxID=30532 RepID=UPI002A371CA8|nr:protein SPT2 homolog [Dama dama]